jgi:diacylglycerol kinase
MEPIKEKKRFSIVARVKSATHAGRGIFIMLKTSHNTWGHIFFIFLVIYLGVLLNVSNIEWILLVLTVSSVVVAEAFNTAIEIDIDLTSPDYHPYARDTKDVAAGAVLLSVIFAIIVGAIIFLPKIFYLLIH